MSDQSAEPETDLRRRAAWLLAMLVLVAVLVVLVMTTLLGTDKGGTKSAQIGPDPITSTGPPATTAPPSSPGTPSGSSVSGTPSSSAGSSAPPNTSATCPTSAPCALDTDVGNGIAAINAYLTQHGKSAVPGSVSDAAKTCALNHGNGCSGGWAETEISAPADGTRAVQQIQQFAKLLDPQMKSIQVGWAYFPSSKTYAFVTIRQG